MSIASKHKSKSIFKLILVVETIVLSLFPLFSNFYDTNSIRYLYFGLAIIISFTIFFAYDIASFNEKEIKSVYYYFILFFIPFSFLIAGVADLVQSTNIAYSVFSIAEIIFFVIFATLANISVKSNGSKFTFLFNFIENFYKKLESLAENYIKKL
jgi:hypothetical protein